MNTPTDPLEAKLTDFTELELEVANALGYKNKLPVDKNMFDGGCLCHTYPKNSDSACGNHASILHQIRRVVAIIHTREQQARIDELEKIIGWHQKSDQLPRLIRKRLAQLAQLTKQEEQ